MTGHSGASDARTDGEVLDRLALFRAAVADDLEILAALHDREPSAEIVAALKACPVADQLGLRLASEAGKASLDAMAEALEQLPEVPDRHALDELAAAYADVYLRHTYRAAPTESVWLTEEGLERQAPMFRCRELYRRHELKVTDWANRPDDHLVVELRFLARLMAHAATADDLAEPASFMDDHILLWIRSFASRLFESGAPKLFTALALLTASYLDELRDHLAVITGTARPSAAERNAKAKPCAEREPAAAYIPGVAPSW